MNNYCNPTYYEDEKNIEKLYPEIYKIIYPMVCKICSTLPEKITEETIENMTNEIYINVEAQCINQNINNDEKRNIDIKNVNNKETKQEEKRHQNFLLKDLIRILILRELLLKIKIDIPRQPFQQYRPPINRSIYEQRFYDNDRYF